MESVLGVGIVQKSEPPAICVAEIALRKEDKDSFHPFLVRYLKRLAPGSSFPAIASRNHRLYRATYEKLPGCFRDRDEAGIRY